MAGTQVVVEQAAHMPVTFLNTWVQRSPSNPICAWPYPPILGTDPAGSIMDISPDLAQLGEEMLVVSALVPMSVFFCSDAGTSPWSSVSPVLGNSECSKGHSPLPHRCLLGPDPSTPWVSFLQIFTKMELARFPGLGQEGFSNGTVSQDVCLTKAIEAPLVLTEKERGLETVFEAWKLGYSPWVGEKKSPTRGKKSYTNYTKYI